jgi:hypothetical protein
MKANRLALACMLGLSAVTAGVMGCAGDRPLRNGVPNENLYLRKAFIIRPGTGGTPEKPAEDEGWMLKATVMSTSTPNPLANTVLWPGAENAGKLVRFVATQDKLQLVSLRELSATKQVEEQGTRTPEVVNAWGAQHVDLKLAVTADGEKTNRFEENLELDWKIRQWVQVNLAKSDLSDFALFGSQYSFLLQRCTSGAATTVEPGSILVDEPHDYIEWKVNVTMPLRLDDEKCVESYGEAGRNFMRLGRSNVSAVVKYSMVRATPRDKLTYPPLEIGEKDPIRRKYGPIWETSYARDEETGQFAARQFAVRFDPNKDLVLYFAKGYPEEKKGFFKDPGGIVDQTNALFDKAGAKIRLVVKNYDEDMPEDAHPLEKQRGREYGDIRYNFIRWMSDIDIGAPFIGVEQAVPDPRTGEAISASVNIADFPLKEFVGVRVDAFLESIMCRASTKDAKGKDVCTNLVNDGPWGPPLTEVRDANGAVQFDDDGKVKLKALPDQCRDGETVPLLPTKLNETYGISSLYSKMQEYLGEPVAKNGPLGPRDFVPEQDPDFISAYMKVLPYYIFADPAANPFVTPVGDGGEFGEVEQFEALGREAEFHKMTGKLDRGEPPFDLGTGPNYIKQANDFLTSMQKGVLNHRDYLYKREYLHKSTTKLDTAGDLVAFTGVMERAGRRCVGGHWETKEEWMQKLIQTYHALTVWHEFGHFLGLDHNFMGSVDKPNFPHFTEKGCDPAKDPSKCDRVGLYSSSVMEYSATPDRIFWSNESGGPGWAPYDRAAITWLYANETAPSTETRAAAIEEAKKNPPELVSGQLSPTLPWKDPAGFREDGKEISFLYCNADHMRFTPFCRQQDFGVTPSEIIANEIEAYEWQYAWRNFRKYRKTWDISNYADIPAQKIVELRRFLPPWRTDWRDDTLRDDFGRFNINLPPGANSKQLYYQQLATKFDDELSQTNQMVAAFHLALIQQSSGERPFATVYDKFNGDVTQQGITLDKQFAMQGWVGLWPSDNYDPNQRGNFISSYGDSFDPEYNSVAQKAVASMIGQEQFDAFPYLQIAAVVLFARDTHNPQFGGQNNIKDWVGGYVFSEERKMLNFFRRKAVERAKYPELGCATGNIDTCTYDPRVLRADTGKEYLSDVGMEFLGPDDRNYIWVEVPDRQWWVFVDRSRNIATYKKMRDYHTQVTANQIQDDRLYTYLLPIKTHMDAYIQFNNGPAIP